MVTAIIVTYNPDELLLEKQLTSLKTQVDNIIYVDNGSYNVKSIENLIKDRFTLIKNGENYGLAKAQNQGIAYAKKHGADFVLLFDQDSVPQKLFVDGLIRCYNDQSIFFQVALVGPVIRNMINGSNENEEGVVFRGIFINRVYIEKATEVTYCIASGSLIPLKVINEIGGLCEKMFIDGIDVEWCLRAKSKGYKIFQTNNTYLEHCLGDGTSRRILSHSPQREYFIMRNSIVMARKNYIPLGYRFRKAFFSIGRFMQSLLSLKLAYITADLKGFYDGIKL